MKTTLSIRKLFPPLLAVALLFLGIAGETAFAANAAKELQDNFISVAVTLKPSVVNIRVEKTEEQPGFRSNSLPNEEGEGNSLGDFLQKFFQTPQGRRFRMPRNNFKTQGAGSGVVFNEDGHILTNNHVIKGASKITVKLSDGQELEGKVVGQDPQSDLAVVKVNASRKLTPARFADSNAIQPGQWCMAIGNPFGLEQSVTVGVVSALGRSGLGAAAFEDFIQTDASINPGNSGGPLVDLEGQVIGINTLIFAAPGSGIGFAIPSSMAKRIATQIISTGAVERPFIGISMREITPDLAEHYSLKDRNGAVVLDIRPDTPAAKAGLKQMDIIREIDGQGIPTTADVQKYVFSRNIGDTIKVKILRNGQDLEIPIKLEKMPKSYGLREGEDLADNSETAIAPESVNVWGFKVQSLTPEAAKKLGADPQGKGLVVTEVRADSAADKGGLMENDIITQANGEPVSEPAGLEKALKTLPEGKKSSVIVVQREGNPLFLVLPDPNTQ